MKIPLLMDRSTAILWSQTMIHRRTTVFLDTETTGLGPTAEIIDIALVSATGQVLFDSLVRPRGPIPPGATAVHGLRDEHVESAPTWDQVWPLIKPLLRDETVVVYNADFDFEMVRQDCDKLGETIRCGQWCCAMKAYAAFREERTPGRAGFRWHKLPDAARHFGVPPGGHRALADAEACRQVVIAMAGASGEKSLS